MPLLKNHRHERFAQEIVQGRTLVDAYMRAGYAVSTRNAANVGACNLLKRAQVRRRVDELLARAAERAEIRAEMVIRELGRIAFSDIRDVAKWRTGSTELGHAVGPGGPAILTSPEVALIDSDELSDDAAAAIALLVRGPDGRVRLRLHNKLAALVALAKLIVATGQSNEVGPASEFAHLNDAQKRQRAIEIAKELGLDRLAQASLPRPDGSGE